MGSLDKLRSFAESHSSDGALIRDGLTYGDARSALRVLIAIEQHQEETARSPSCVEQLARLEALVREYFEALDNQTVGLQYKGAVRARMIRARQIRLSNAEDSLRYAVVPPQEKS